MTRSNFDQAAQTSLDEERGCTSDLAQTNQLEQILAQLAQIQRDNQRFQNDVRGQVDQLKKNINQLREDDDELRQEVRQGFQKMSTRLDAA